MLPYDGVVAAVVVVVASVLVLPLRFLARDFGSSNLLLLSLLLLGDSVIAYDAVATVDVVDDVEAVEAVETVDVMDVL